jgi:hypothetical protein
MPGTGTLGGVDAVREGLGIALCMLVSIAAVLSLVVVWWDDHKWLDRPER